MVSAAEARQPTPGQAALVTGASYGVGAATALTLAKAGIDVAVTATKIGNLAATMTALEATGVGTLALALDLHDQASIEAAVRETARKFGNVDILINNAAATTRKAAVDVTRDEWDKVIGANLSGTYFISTEFARLLIGSDRPGCIVNVTSTHGLIGAAERSVYGISKGGVIQMTRMLAIEWADKGIRVNAVAPGRLDTPSPSRAATASDPSYLKTMLARIPLHRLTTAEEVAAAVAFLAGPQAASITGQILAIDGGITAA
jgi:NAD(P)-dependent dehydrogenase (short-subunit alcohol dehydrogenase family)